MKVSRQAAPTKNAPMGVIRIIGGKWRGKKLPVLDAAGLRPTTDRNKETLFNWLMTDISGSYCLDCFAGSGSLGFEACSRGAAGVTLLEKTATTARQLQKNAASLSQAPLAIHQTDTLVWLNRPAERQFNIVFIDPPFYAGLIAPVVQLLEQHHWLAEQALIYIEVEKDNSQFMQAVPANWRSYRQKQAGQVTYYLFVRDTLQA